MELIGGGIGIVQRLAAHLPKGAASSAGIKKFCNPQGSVVITRPKAIGSPGKGFVKIPTTSIMPRESDAERPFWNGHWQVGPFNAAWLGVRWRLSNGSAIRVMARGLWIVADCYVLI